MRSPLRSTVWHGTVGLARCGGGGGFGYAGNIARAWVPVDSFHRGSGPVDAPTPTRWGRSTSITVNVLSGGSRVASDKTGRKGQR